MAGVVKSVTTVNGIVQAMTGGSVEYADLDAVLQAAITSISGRLVAANNLSDLTNSTAALANLGLTSSMTSADFGISADDEDSLFGYDVAAAAVRRFPASRVVGNLLTFQARLTTESGVPISSSDRTSQSTVYLTPYNGDRISLYDGTRWVSRTLAEIAIALSGLTSGRPYDVWAFTSSATPSSTNTGTDVLTFGSATGWATGSMVRVSATGGGLTAGTVYYYNAASSTTGSLHATLANALAGTSKIDLTASVTATLTAVSLELLSWTNSTTRATAIATQNGVPVKTGDATRRLVGVIFTTSTSATEDSLRNRYVANVYNAVPRRMFFCPGYNNNATNTSYTDATNTFKEANGSGNGNVGFVTPLPGYACQMSASAIVITSASGGANAGLGFDGTTDIRAMGQTNTANYLQTFGLHSGYTGSTPGKHAWYLCTYSQAGTATWFADGANTVGGGSADYPDTYLEGWAML